MTYSGPLILLTDDDSMIEPLDTSGGTEPSDDIAAVHADADRRVLASLPVAGCSLPLPDVALLTPDCVALTSCSPPRSPADRERMPLLVHTGDGHPENSAEYNNFPDDVEYSSLLSEAEQAIEHGIAPLRISRGSSGSYFVKNRDGVCVVLFFSHNICTGSSNLFLSILQCIISEMHPCRHKTSVCIS